MPDEPKNPFAPPRSSDLAAPTQTPGPGPIGGEPPTSVPKVFGVLSIVFSSVMMLGGLLGSCSLCAGQVMSAVPRAGGEHAAEMRALFEPMKTVYSGFGLVSLIFLAMSIWLLIVGIGQLRYRAWAQKQSVAWGGLALACVGAMVAINVLMIGPAYKEMFEAMAHMPEMMKHGGAAPKMPAGMGSLLGGSMSLMTVVFYAPYPILMLALFSRERVKQAMTN